MNIKARIKHRDIIVKIIGFLYDGGILWAICSDRDGEIDGYNIENVKIIDDEYLP